MVRAPDLDGDGEDELDLTAGCGWNWSWPHVLFLSDGCTFAGLLWSADVLTNLPQPAPSLPDIVTHSSDGCAGSEFTEELFRWNGSQYQSVARVGCNFCEDPEAPPPGPQPSECNEQNLTVAW